jgi:hypothetical protein
MAGIIGGDLIGLLSNGPLSQNDLGQVIVEVKNLLQGIESDNFTRLPVAFRFALYLCFAKIAFETILGALRGIARVFHGAVCGMLNFVAPNLPFEFTGPLAWFFVKFEAVMFGTRLLRSRKPIIMALPRRRNLAVSKNSSWRTFARIYNAGRFVVISPLVAATSLFVAPFILVWKLVRITPVNIASLLTMLWYMGFLRKLLELASGISLGEIQLSVVLAAGTLFTFIYSIANSDVRGRAELNKVASLACRTALHSCTYPLLASANALHEIRIQCTRRLQRFPRRHEIKRIARRPDLEWRGRILLPRGAHPVEHHWRASKLLKSRFIRRFLTDWVYSRRRLQQPGDRLVKKLEVGVFYATIEDARSIIVKKVSELRESGMLGKIDRVLDRSGIDALATSQDVKFGQSDSDELLAAGESSWLDTITSVREKEELLSSWESLRGVAVDDPELRRACVDLTRKLRHFVRLEHAKHWRAAVTEQRLSYLAECIDKHLRPRFLERVRQQFGK